MNAYLKVIKDIKGKKELDNNLKEYFDILLSDYMRMSNVRMAMNYYTLYESINEYSFITTGNIKEILEKITELALLYVDGKVNTQSDEILDKIENIRSELRNRVDELVSLSKAFSVAEYAINRVEHRFDETPFEVDSDDIILHSLLSYIFSDKDNVVINDKIKLIMGQLPVRMAKSKFYNMIANTFTLYNGSDKTSLDDFVSGLSMSALMDINIKGYFGEYAVILNELLEHDYKDIEKEEFDNLKDKLDKCTEFINLATDGYSYLMEIANDLYEIVVCSNLTDNDFPEIKASISIICKVASNISSNVYDEEFSEMFTEFEGTAEELIAEISSVESILEDINENHDEKVHEIGCTPKLKAALVCSLLNSTSKFVDIKKAGKLSESDQKADDNYIDIVTNLFLEKLSVILGRYNGLVKRGIMASVLSQLPVRFRTSDELSEFLLSSISACKDTAEKAAFAEITRQIIMD